MSKNITGGLSIFYGPEIWTLQNYGGISRYFAELISRMSHVNKNIKAFIPVSNNSNESKIPFNSKILCNDTKTTRLIQLAQNSNQFHCKELIYHATFFGNTKFNLWHEAGFKNILTVFDLIPEKFPDKKLWKRPRTNFKKIAVNSANHIICISNTTKLDLMDIYNIPSYKISVVYLGCELQNNSLEHLEFRNKSNFILYVGNRQGYKNFKRFLKAYSQSKFLSSNFYIIAFGGQSFSKEEYDLIMNLKLEEKVLQISGDDENLKLMYKTAAALVYPSIYEGFGLPPIEAMSHGCPVIASNQGSIPEICQDAAVYFNPYNIEEMSFVMEKFLRDTKLQMEKIQLGIKTVKLYTWENTQLRTNEIYHSLHTKNGLS